MFLKEAEKKPWRKRRNKRQRNERLGKLQIENERSNQQRSEIEKENKNPKRSMEIYQVPNQNELNSNQMGSMQTDQTVLLSLVDHLIIVACCSMNY